MYLFEYKLLLFIDVTYLKNNPKIRAA